MNRWALRALARLFCAWLLLAAEGAHAQRYPMKPILLVSPYGAGGNADLAARALGLVAPKYLGQQIVVIDRLGAGGIVGSQYVLDAAKDGYTLLAARVGSQAVAPALDPSTPYKWDSFTMIAMLEIDPYVCVVSAKSAIKSVQDLVAAVRARPGQLNYASTGNADASVVFPVKILLNAGLKADAAVKVPYKGTPETISAVLGGHVDFTCNGLGPFTGGIKAGELRALVVSTRARVPEAPEVPTAGEIGMPDLELVSGWTALYGPAGLPKNVVDAWVSALAKVKDDPEWTKQVRTRGSVPSIMTPAETRRFVESQYNAYRALAPQIGIAQ